MEGKRRASQPLKKMLPQLLISVSLFSFLLSYSSLLYTSSSPSPKFHHYFSANSFHLLSKNCLFLICNGLLVFLAKTSGFIQPPAAAHDLNDMLHVDALQVTALDKYVLEESEGEKTDGGTEEVSIFIAESEEEGEAAAPDSPHDDKDHETQPNPTTCWLFDDNGEQLYGQEGDGEGCGDEDEDEDEYEEGEMMSTDELNRKFEDFIRKMKEEIIINEARQKVVVLN